MERFTTLDQVQQLELMAQFMRVRDETKKS